MSAIRTFDTPALRTALTARPASTHLSAMPAASALTPRLALNARRATIGARP